MAGIGGPNIITDGLVLSLDAANAKSFPGSGTIWKDLSGKGVDGVLTNGPTFNSGNKGIIDFDGTNDYVVVPNILDVMPASISFFLWVNLDQMSTNNGLCSKNNISGQDRFYFFTNPDGSLRFHYEENNNGYTQNNSSTGLISANEWIHIGFTWDSSNGFKLWINGINVYTNSISTSLPRNGTFTDFWIGCYGSSSPGSFINGKISNAKLYNEPLTSQEIQQNYNATKQRFK